MERALATGTELGAPTARAYASTLRDARVLEIAMKAQRQAVVVGAGVAGLVTAAQLAHRGYGVTVLEKQSMPGGRAAQATWDGFTFDLGPTLLFMLDVYRTAFASWGGDFDAEVPTVRLRPNYRLHYPDGSSLLISSLLSETLASLERMSPGSSRGFLEYFAEAAEAYEVSPTAMEYSE